MLWRELKWVALVVVIGVIIVTIINGCYDTMCHHEYDTINTTEGMSKFSEGGTWRERPSISYHLQCTKCGNIKTETVRQ